MWQSGIFNVICDVCFITNGIVLDNDFR